MQPGLISNGTIGMQRAQTHGRQRATDVLVIVVEDSNDGVVARLSTSLGTENATHLYRAFLLDLHERFCRAKDVDGYDLCWACLPTFDLPGPALGIESRTPVQRGEEITERRFNICNDIAARGYQRLIITGSDLPHLPVSIVRQCFKALDGRDVVFGPGDHCGYYLVGVHLYPEPPNLFRGIQMDTSTALAQTLVRAADLHCSVALLAPTFDAGDAYDPHHLLNVLQHAGTAVAPRTTEELRRLINTEHVPHSIVHA